MPKAKKGNKKQSAVESDSDGDFVDPIKAAAMEEGGDDPVLSLPAAPPTKQKKSKANKKKAKKRDDEDDDEEEALEKFKQLALSGSEEEDLPRPVKKQTRKNKVVSKPTAASAFSMLGVDSEGSASRSEGSDNEPAPTSDPPHNGKGGGGVDAELSDHGGEDIEEDDLTHRLSALPADSGDEAKPVISSKKEKKKQKKQKKKKGDPAPEDDDLDAILANLDNPATGEKPLGKKNKKEATTAPSVDFPTPQASAEGQPAQDGLPQSTMIVETAVVGEEGEESAAAKKRRKKQKQKERKEEVEGTATVKTEPGGDGEEKAEPGGEGEEKAEPGGEGEEEKDADEGDAEDTNKKKRKKKKDKKAAEGESAAGVPASEDKKKPKNKAIAAMKEALAKAKEEQERMEREEEEKIKKLEEAKRLRDEEKKMKEEQRRKQREKDKERKERKKAEGKALTPAQKVEKERVLQLLESRGIELPKPGEKKKPYYGKPRKNKQQLQAKAEEKTPDASTAPEDTAKPEIALEKAEAPSDVPAEEAAADTDIKDSWDVDSEEEEVVNEEEQPGEKPSAVGAEKVAVEQKAAENPEEEESSGAEHEEEESDTSASDDSSEEESSSEEEMSQRERALARIQKRQQVAESNISTDKLRAPVVCVLGHVDTGKTKILDKLRRTNVQDGEAGGITQQIGATNVPLDAIHKQTSFVKDFKLDELKVPGLLIIDTPGHESFSNLRTRGSSLCDIAILVIDIMHGLEPQTLESIQLLRKGKTPFIVALNKIDRLYGWKASPHQDVQAVIKKQTPNTKAEFDERAAVATTQLAEQGLNAALFYDNPNPKEYISLVPTSAHSGDGMGNLIALLCQYSQTFLAKRVAITDNLQCTVMEVKALPGLGTTVDVILVNGKLHNGDVVVMPGSEGPIVTHIRELLMPEPMRELRVKSQFKHHKEVEAAQGVKIVGKDLDKVLAGLPMYVAKYQDEVEVYKEWIAAALKNVLNAIRLSSVGVFVQSSTLGSMEALLEYLRSVKVPYAGINIGPVHKKDVMKASVMVEHGEPQYATILAFDVKVERDANELADSLGVKIFTADIIYHLFDAFTKYQDDLVELGRSQNNHLKIFPCKLRILPQHIFNSRDPIIMGVSVESGFLSNGTPICVPTKEFIGLGIVTSIERENKSLDKASKGMEVCVKIENPPGHAPRLYGRHFDENDMLVSKISRESINAVRKYWRADMSKEDWKLIIELKKTFDIL